MNEAARVTSRAEDADASEDETLEEQEAKVKQSRSDRMRLRVEVVSKLWEAAPDEEKRAAQMAVEAEKAELIKEAEAKKLKESGEGVANGPEKTPEELQQ